MLPFTLSTPAYLKRLLLALLILPCLVVAEQAQQALDHSFSDEPGMSVAEHYTLGGDSLRLRHSRELESTVGGNLPDISAVSIFERTLLVVKQVALPSSPIISRSISGFTSVVLARAPPAGLFAIV